MRYILFLTITIITFSGSLIAQDEFFTPKTTYGGYGEIHYNYAKVDDAEAKKTLDFHRFVIFLSHSWTEKWSFKSELELEHNFIEGGEKTGELELEQAYINYHHSEKFGFQVGVILPSVGLINEYHEPPLFLSVERPDYSKDIIPTTWFGNGAAIYGQLNTFSYKLVVMEGLDGSSFGENGGIRGGRVKGYKANADELLYNIRLDYTGLPGLMVGSSFSYNNAIVAQDSSIETTLFEVHARYNKNNVISIFEYGNISYDGLNAGYNVESSLGYYFDLGYNIADIVGCEGELIPWFRYTDYNLAASVKNGGEAEKTNHFTKWMLGIAYKPINEVVFKLDFGIKKRESDNMETTLFNIGGGYMF